MTQNDHFYDTFAQIWAPGALSAGGINVVLRRARILDVVAGSRMSAVQTRILLCTGTLLVGFLSPIDLYILGYIFRVVSGKYIYGSRTPGPRAGRAPE